MAVMSILGGLGLGVGYISALAADHVDVRILMAVFILIVVLALVYSFTIDNKDKNEQKRSIHLYFDIGRRIFKAHEPEFEAYYSKYMNSKPIVLRPIDVLARFADQKELSLIIDWRGEGHEGEIQDFVASKVDKEINWSKTLKLRESNVGGETRDGKFIIRLFQAIEKDLENTRHHLLFFDLGGDSYVLMVSDPAAHETIISTRGIELHGARKFRT